MRQKSLLALTLLGALSAVAAADAPVAVSPGTAREITPIDQRCPSFSWSAVEDARAYELVVYRLSEGLEAGLEEAEPILQQDLPGGALSWTPPTHRCLAPGGRYAWFVRAEGKEGASEWSEAKLFSLTAEPSVTEVKEALKLLQQYVAEGGTLEGLEPAATPEHAAATESDATHLAERDGPPAETPSALSGPTAIRGEQSDPTGTTFGVVGESASPDGAGLGAANTAGGADLVLDGTADSETDALLTQAGIDRPSATAETFEIGNSDAGSMTLQVDKVSSSGQTSLATGGAATSIGGALSVTGTTSLSGAATLGDTLAIGANDISGTIFSVTGSTGGVTAGSLTSSGLDTPTAGTLTLGGSNATEIAVAPSLAALGDVILGDANTDTLTVNAGPVSLPNATSAADALVLGGDADLYRGASGFLETDGSLKVGGSLLSTQVITYKIDAEPTFGSLTLGHAPSTTVVNVFKELVAHLGLESDSLDARNAVMLTLGGPKATGVAIDDPVLFTPRSAAPSCSAGTIYYDSDDGDFCVCRGTTWFFMDGTATVSGECGAP